MRVNSLLRRYAAALIVMAAAFTTAFTSLEASAEVQWPDTNYDEAVPTVSQVLGYESGERITWSHDVRRYFEVLASHAPDQVRIVEYGETWERRPLFYVVISSPENVARLDDIKAGMQSLRDPRGTSTAAAERLIKSIAPVTWLAYGVHGNEISSSDASMMTAYHLLAARGEARVDTILEDTVVVLVPMQNPDGRDRFIHRFEIAAGLETELLDVIKAAGVEVNEADKVAFVAASAPIYEEFASTVDGAAEMIETVQSLADGS